MQNNDFRAKQFLAFDALDGFSDAIKSVNKMESINYLNFHVGDFITINYYDNLDYIETCGVIKKIDLKNRYIYLLNNKISFDNIIKIT